MWFNFYVFVIFFVFVYAAYRLLSHRPQSVLLLVANYYFVDTESCVKATAKTAGIDYESEFSWHPGPEGHAIYASCLQRTLLPLIL